MTRRSSLEDLTGKEKDPIKVSVVTPPTESDDQKKQSGRPDREGERPHQSISESDDRKNQSGRPDSGHSFRDLEAERKRRCHGLRMQLSLDPNLAEILPPSYLPSCQRSSSHRRKVLNSFALYQLSSHSTISTDPSSLDITQPQEPVGRLVTPMPLSLSCFTFHRELAKGSFGQVYQATDIRRKEQVAIKVMDKLLYKSRGYSFVERQILRNSYGSPYLIHGLAAFHTNGYVYYVMELANRGDLDTFIQNTLHSPDREAEKFIAVEMVCGAQYLHKQGILHRDLAPKNILLTSKGHIKITDFGHAMTSLYPQSISFCQGTPGYAAPEIVRGLSHGRGADFFSIGAILYRLMTLEMAFPGENPGECEQAVLNHTPLFPKFLTFNQVSVLEGLLCKDQYQRLGVKKSLRRHPYFAFIDWEDADAGRIEPPAIMKTDAADPNTEETLHFKEPFFNCRFVDQKKFLDFSFVCAEWSEHYHPVRNISCTSRLMERLSTVIRDYCITCGEDCPVHLPSPQMVRSKLALQRVMTGRSSLEDLTGQEKDPIKVSVVSQSNKTYSMC
ncbi:protein kinase C delta type-like [Engystomops pustulosus]|uniref:protein kinase C delta type-like n=1 Tax=Engystomops pustulosus TaxID=76066 RepID=UPI003AFB1351